MFLPPTIHRLDNGVRIATVPMPHMESVAAGLWTNTGSRHEARSEHGMAHLVEHMLFKGTPTRTAADISREIESLGSSIDGFTVEDHTAYHAKAPAAEFGKLFDVLSDFFLHPILDPKDLASEKQVIHEEIAMIRDLPSQWIEDLSSEVTWGERHPLGRSITGTDESLDAFQRDDLLRFYRKAYCGRNTVILVAGAIDPEEVVETAARAFESLHPGRRADGEAAPRPSGEYLFVEEDDYEQAYLALAFPGADRQDPTRFALRLLNVILGENMSSRLFQELRERQGLCYEVQSDVVSFDDAGLLQIFLSLSHENLGEALNSISRVMNDLLRHRITAAELASAKAYLIGQSRISLENTSSVMMWGGECLLFFDDWIDPESIHESIAAVSLDEVHEAAQNHLDPTHFSSALIGPDESDSTFRRWRAAVA